jgi:transcriptional regulator with XRE-family HTH domain
VDPQATSAPSEQSGVDGRVADLGGRIKARRIALGHTQAELAARTGLTRATINRLERGNTDLSVGRLLRICDALDWTLSDLVMREPH